MARYEDDEEFLSTTSSKHRSINLKSLFKEEELVSTTPAIEMDVEVDPTSVMPLSPELNNEILSEDLQDESENTLQEDPKKSRKKSLEIPDTPNFERFPSTPQSTPIMPSISDSIRKDFPDLVTRPTSTPSSKPRCFISADCKLVTPIGYLLTDFGFINEITLKEEHARRGSVIGLQFGVTRIFSLVCRGRFFDLKTENDLYIAVSDLRNAMYRTGTKTIRISKSNYALEKLPENALHNIIRQVFSGSSIIHK